ncbi:MAG: ACP S-malonyltransferase [candidate division KSB1 bacterium]|nr:ACP S-malonyltransferase [candidate division KSB1 bacterium]MDZ7338905.1 ACP S-malonyltransferase [candidate division KSB1 bacterium]MDZ7377862.1 ACP S-malonyltransferase [candidate division KSB1 bacterium]MDZ7385870.1 ACP S-malonyltransferase [candidate division KSB1 bacterium]MDZ7393650.1 ACP S-malonyltransferase [candidate division KSB1 bacterium]
MIAFQFPGQASQYVGMAQDLFEASALARDYYARANEMLGFDLAEVSFNGPEERLKQTAITQPAIFVHSVVANELLRKRGVVPHMAAGHSLGEYSALVAAGALSFEDGLRLVKRRGELMQEAGTISPGTMAAIIGLEADVVEELCGAASEAGVVQAANYNCPGQTVISGAVPAVQKAMELARARGAKRVVELVVSGAFHSPLMDHARQHMGEVLEAAPIRDAAVPVYANVTAHPVQKASEIRRLLLEQLSRPVLWHKAVENMIADGAKIFYEVGPGSVLTGLLKRINREVKGVTAGTAEEIAQI